MRYDWWIHSTGATASYPTGGGGATATPAASHGRPGACIVLHSIVPLTGATGPLTILNGAAANYFGSQTWPLPAATAGAGIPLDVVLENGLGISGGTTGAWLISYALLR